MDVWFAVVVAAVGALGFLAGLVRARYHPAPVVATVVVVLVYAGLVMWAAVWASRGDGDDGRGLAVVLAVLGAGLPAFAGLIGTWAGAWVSMTIWPHEPRLHLKRIALSGLALGLLAWSVVASIP